MLDEGDECAVRKREKEEDKRADRNRKAAMASQECQKCKKLDHRSDIDRIILCSTDEQPGDSQLFLQTSSQPSTLCGAHERGVPHSSPKHGIFGQPGD